jgi:hypothetical protein
LVHCCLANRCIAELLNVWQLDCCIRQILQTGSQKHTILHQCIALSRENGCVKQSMA